METMLSAYTELVQDTVRLCDPDDAGNPFSAIEVQLVRHHYATYSIDVALRQIDGAQLAFVLDIARKYELDVREDNGWLTLQRHLTSADLPEEDREPEEVVA